MEWDGGGVTRRGLSGTRGRTAGEEIRAGKGRILLKSVENVGFPFLFFVLRVGD